MATELVTARVMAARLTRELKRPITDKAVRAWVRANLATHDKVKHPEYQSHAYSADEQRRITAGFKARSTRAVIQAQGKAPRKAATATARKATKPTATKPKSVGQATAATKPDGAPAA